MAAEAAALVAPAQAGAASPSAPPRGLWRLPPQQCCLEAGQTTFDLHRVAQELTVLVSTSVGDFTPDTSTLVAALESLQSNVALRWCRKLLVFDAVPSEQEIEAMRADPKAFRDIVRGPKWIHMWNAKRDAYQEYCDTLTAMKEANHPALFNVEFKFLSRFGHLVGTVREAFRHIDTKYVFLTQHDLRLSGKFVAADVQNILEALHDGQAKYVVLNRDVNSSIRSRTYFKMVPERSLRDDAKRPAGLSLTGVSGYSDQSHFAESEWYRKNVVEAIPEDQLTCMEHVLHAPWRDGRDWRGTFLYGGADEGPFILDLVYGTQVYDAEGRLRKLPPPPSRPVA